MSAVKRPNPVNKAPTINCQAQKLASELPKIFSNPNTVKPLMKNIDITAKRIFIPIVFDFN